MHDIYVCMDDCMQAHMYVYMLYGCIHLGILFVYANVSLYIYPYIYVFRDTSM